MFITSSKSALPGVIFFYLHHRRWIHPQQHSLCVPYAPPGTTNNLRLNLSGLLKHVKLFHAHQSRFQIVCGIGGCERTYTKFRSYEVHVSSIHRFRQHVSNTSIPSEVRLTGREDEQMACNVENFDFETPHSSEDCGQGEESQNVETNVSSGSHLQKCSAQFLMRLKEKHKLTQGAVQTMIEGVTSLHQEHMHTLHSNVHKTLASKGVDSSIIQEIDSHFIKDGEYPRPFLGLETQYQQEKFYKTHLNFIVSATDLHLVHSNTHKHIRSYNTYLFTYF